MSDRDLEFREQLENYQQVVDGFITEYFDKWTLPAGRGPMVLKKSMEYSTLSGGKRFRPVLCLLMAESFGLDQIGILPLAAAIELIHTYSLIHDDLPCMDNDDLRRGQPTNHKVFGESTALMAGAGLLTEAFAIIAKYYNKQANAGLRLVQILSEAAGSQGMIAGQVLDMQAKDQRLNFDELKLMQSLKTGALIRVCCEATAVLADLPVEKVLAARDFGVKLGLAFQLADDLLDSNESKIEVGSVPEAIGLEKTREYLIETSGQAHHVLKVLGISDGPLHDLVRYNSLRKK